MNNLRVFLNGCENETKTVDMRQSTLEKSTTPTSDKFIWLFQSTKVTSVIYVYMIHYDTLVTPGVRNINESVT